jgi:hyperosmotically inducible periplasmic protein
MMKSRGLSILALPVLLFATAAFAMPQGVKEKTKDAGQAVKDTAKKTGNAISDSWITLKVHSQFVPEDTLEGRDIDVDTKNGVVTLNGTVPTEAGRARAMAIAKATDGVTNVTDNLRIAAAHDMSAMAGQAARDAGKKAKEATGTTGKAITDGWIKSKLAAQYVTEDSLDKSDIDIDVSKGNVVLNGAVRTTAARARAAEIAKTTDGVKSVKNNLKIDPNVK